MMVFTNADIERAALQHLLGWWAWTRGGPSTGSEEATHVQKSPFLTGAIQCTLWG